MRVEKGSCSMLTVAAFAFVLIVLIAGLGRPLAAQSDDPTGVECEGDSGDSDFDGGSGFAGWYTQGKAAQTDTNCFSVPVGPPGEEGWLDHPISSTLAGATYEIAYATGDLQLESPDRFQLLQLCRKGDCESFGSAIAIELGRNDLYSAYRLTIGWESDDATGGEAPALDVPENFRLRVAWRRSTRPPGGPARRDGNLQVWVDDLIIFERRGLLLSRKRPDLAQAGACGGVDLDTAGSMTLQIKESARLY